MQEIKNKKRTYLATVRMQLEAPTIAQGKQQTRSVLSKMYNLQVENVKCLSGKRSVSQNNSLHLWIEQVAEKAKENDLTIDMLITKPTEVPITAEIIKDLMRFTGQKMYGKDSTAKWNKDEFNEIVKMFDKAFIEKLDIDIEFPNLQLLINKEDNLK